VGQELQQGHRRLELERLEQREWSRGNRAGVDAVCGAVVVAVAVVHETLPTWGFSWAGLCVACALCCLCVLCCFSLPFLPPSSHPSPFPCFSFFPSMTCCILFPCLPCFCPLQVNRFKTKYQLVGFLTDGVTPRSVASEGADVGGGGGSTGAGAGADARTGVGAGGVKEKEG
jgi:hypothetical protein